MRLLFFLIMALFFVSQSTDILAAGQIKIKYVGSIYTDTDGVALKQPAGVTVTDNSLLVADSGGRRILSYIYRDGTIKSNKTFPLPKMFPLMVQQATNGDLYVLDGRERQIYVLSPTGKVSGKLVIKGLPGAERIVPRSIKTGPDGSLLVLDVFSDRLLFLDNSGSYQRQILFPDTYGAITDMTMDKQGNVYLLDSVQAIIYKAGSVADKFTPLTAGMKEDMNFPTNLATDNRGTLYLVDKHGSGLAVVGVDGTFAGRKLNMGWSDSQLYYPSQISISDSGDLFIADTENNRIQQFNIND